MTTKSKKCLSQNKININKNVREEIKIWRKKTGKIIYIYISQPKALPIPWRTFTNMQLCRQITNLIVEVSEVSEAASAIPESSVLFSYRWTLKYVAFRT